MRKAKSLVAAVLALSLLIIPIALGCSPPTDSGLKVVTSTSLLASIVERVGGAKVDVVNIIPPAQCPGHFDVKPGDIQKLANADLFLMHGWQGEKFSQDLIASANNPSLTVHKIDIKGNWMTPPVQLTAIDEITAILSRADTQNSSLYQESAAKLKDKIEAKGTEIKTRLAKENLVRINVMCAEQLIGFVKWTGLNVIATYGRPDSLTPQVVKELVDKGKEAKVSLIIDNLQSGQDARAGIAEELGCKRIILSNFPGGFDNTETWEKAIDRNVELILGSIAN
ncbi:metal ABC transporter substrate-binding protein [Chloroflexota bacterium]